MRRSVATCVALLWNHRSSRNAISASIDGGTIDSILSTSSTALRAPVVHLLAVVLIDVDS
jgi:hypothetical protein